MDNISLLLNIIYYFAPSILVYFVVKYEMLKFNSEISQIISDMESKI